MTQPGPNPLNNAVTWATIQHSLGNIHVEASVAEQEKHEGCSQKRVDHGVDGRDTSYKYTKWIKSPIQQLPLPHRTRQKYPLGNAIHASNEDPVMWHAWSRTHANPPTAAKAKTWTFFGGRVRVPSWSSCALSMSARSDCMQWLSWHSDLAGASHPALKLCRCWLETPHPQH